MNIYELTQQALMLQEMLESGEIDDQTFADTIEAMGVAEKAENICKVIRNLEAKAAAYKAEKDRLAKRQKECENGVEKLKDSLLWHLTMMDSKKVDAGLFTVTKSSTKSAGITDETLIPDDYLKPQPPTVDKAQILKDLKEGKTVAGAELVVSEYVRIR